MNYSTNQLQDQLSSDRALGRDKESLIAVSSLDTHEGKTAIATLSFAASVLGLYHDCANLSLSRLCRNELV